MNVPALIVYMVNINFNVYITYICSFYTNLLYKYNIIENI